MKLKDFIFMNQNTNVIWEINDNTYNDINKIPESTLESCITNWFVEQLEGIIVVKTEYGDK